MALIVETGLLVAGAESYVQVTDADTYNSARQNLAAWSSAPTSTKENALRQAVDYMQQVYRNRWKGYRTATFQALDWPRQSVLVEDSVLNAWIPNNTIPAEVKNAQMELALRIVAGTVLAPDITRRINRVHVGDVDINYDAYSPQYTTYRAIDGWLRPYLTYAGAMVPLIRA